MNILKKYLHKTRPFSFSISCLLASTLFGLSHHASSTPFNQENFIETSVTRHTMFYVGGSYAGESGKEIMAGQMYVEGWAPAKVKHKYPLVLFHGSGQTATNWMGTPDGRKGWADFFVDQGYVVYMIDQPSRGRSPWQPDTGGPLKMANVPFAQRLFTAPETYNAWPQADKHTQWPSDGKGVGRMGQPSFDAFYAGIVQTLVDNKQTELLVQKAASALLDKIGPAILLVHSQAGLFGWSIADARPNLVKGIVAVEPSGPPFQNATQAVRELPWGLTNIPVTYSPPVSDPAEILIERQAQPDRKDLVQCWRQREPARKLVNLENIPVLIVTAEASYHAPYDHCTSAYLSQAGVKTTFWRLEDLGIKGNGHLMMLERNNLEIAQLLNGWITRSVK